jgi:hypothetical protein
MQVPFEQIGDGAWHALAWFGVGGMGPVPDMFEVQSAVGCGVLFGDAIGHALRCSPRPGETPEQTATRHALRGLSATYVTIHGKAALDWRMSRQAKGEGRPVENAQRDAWVAGLRDRSPPVAWEAIYRELCRIGPEKGWSIPDGEAALQVAYQRLLKRRRGGGESG